MGVIRRQSVISSVFSYFGVVIGFVSTALIMPNVLQTDQIGLLKLIVAVTGIFSSLFSFGVGQLLFRALPKIQSNDYKRSFLFGFAIKTAIAGILIAIPFFIYFSSSLLNLESKTLDFDKGVLFLLMVFITIVSQIFFNTLFSYYRMFNQVAIGAFIQNVFHRLGILIILIALAFDYLTYSSFLYLYLGLYLFFPIILFLFVYFNKHFGKEVHNIILFDQTKASKFSKNEKKEFYRLLIFGTITTIGGSLYLYVDTLMVNFYLTESEVGIYGTMFLFGIIIIIPARGLKSISISILSKLYNEDKSQEIEVVYKKSSITSLVIGGYIFMGVWCNLNSVFAFLPLSFRAGEYVVLFIGLGHFFDMMTGVNSEIISVSRNYKLNTYFIFFSIFVGILINLWLIPLYGISGAALATMITIVLTNILRLIAVYRLFSMHPFSMNTARVLGCIIVIILTMYFFPDLENALLSIILKGFVITFVYFMLIYFLKVSEDINSIIDKVFRMFYIKRL